MSNLLRPTVFLVAGLGVACFVGCATMSKSTSTITHAPFGTTRTGASVELYTLRNGNGAEVQIMTYGGIVTSLKVPDRNGALGDVVLGYDHLDGYLNSTPYFGALIGRYGNRIANGRFTLDGQTYTLPINNAPNTLHGGVKAFDKVVWEVVRADATGQEATLALGYLSKDGEEGFPGNLKVTATYTLTADNALRLNFSATADKPTVVNLTHHSYFNLAGQGNVLNHEVTIHAGKFTPVTASLIPTGELRPVKGTPFDFTAPHKIGERINSADEQIKFGNGYDHNWVLDKMKAGDGQPTLAATVSEPTSGRVMEVLTTEPGVQFYTANFLDGSITGKGGWKYEARNAFCFEPQHFPDSPNHPEFPSTVLRPGQTFKNTIIYKFSVR